MMSSSHPSSKELSNSSDLQKNAAAIVGGGHIQSFAELKAREKNINLDQGGGSTSISEGTVITNGPAQDINATNSDITDGSLVAWGSNPTDRGHGWGTYTNIYGGLVGYLQNVNQQGTSHDIKLSGASHFLGNTDFIAVNVGKGDLISGATVSNFAAINVDDGGIVEDVIVSGSSAFLDVSSGGVSDDVTVDSGGVVNVSSGGLVDGVTVNYSGLMNISNGGVVEGATLYSGGNVNIAAGATVDGAQVYSGASLNENNANIANATAISGGSIYVAGSNGIVSNLTATGNLSGTGSNASAIYGAISVGNGGTASHVVINNDGYGAVYKGVATKDGFNNGPAGVVQGGTVSGYASLDALNGGTILGGTAMSGGLLAAAGISGAGGGAQGYISAAHVMSGGYGLAGGGAGLTVTKNGSKYTLGGSGFISDATVDAGGILDVNTNGTVIGGNVYGTALIENGGLISGVLFSGAPVGNANILPGGAPDNANAYINSNAVFSGNTVEGEATIFVAGTAVGNDIRDRGVIIIGEGNSHYFNSGAKGNGTYYSGDLTKGTATNDVISGGGTQIVSSGGVDSKATALAGGTIRVDAGGTDKGAVIAQGGTLIVNAGGYVSGATIGADQDTWANGVLDDPTSDGAIVSDGGTFADGSLADGAGSGESPSKMGGLIRVEPGATVTGLHMGNYGQIEVLGVQYGAGESVVYSDHHLTLMSNGESVWGATLSGNYNSGAFQIWDDNGTPVIVYDTCFLRGTHISTPQGEVEVQDLRKGDRIWAIVGGKKTARPITALRYAKSQINKALPVDLAGWSVCIEAGAFGENLPERTLWVTPEHCFFFNGNLVPIRMLVNDRNIYYDTSREHFEYFHIETEPHSIILAEGVLTESWLNTEERREAVNLSNGITRLERIPSRTWEKDAAAPLNISADFVGGLWQKIKERAVASDLPLRTSEKKLFSQDCDLQLLLSDGTLMKPLKRRKNQYFFQIPGEKRAVALVSKKFRPSESIGSWVDDRRQLGVLVGKMTVAIGDRFHLIKAHHQAANLKGWDIVENSPCRWTKGEAELPSLGSEEALKFGASLIVEILAGGPYPEQNNPEIYDHDLSKEA
ncbi:hypothetical protein FAI41_07315 [Acetobacteraceae bacterium]|nr:hypothetical protein FAI41_07315 [Acetobacteraceae bacterium]